MSVHTTNYKFLYPDSRQFPFDEVAEKIVRAMENRNWQVPGITVEFDFYGSNERKYQQVRSITGDNFMLSFGRFQEFLDESTLNLSGLLEICIPKQILTIFHDESGPLYYLYIGSDWDAEKNWFMTSSKIHAKFNQQPRNYLKYKGNTEIGRATMLVPYTDDDRDYAPQSGEPTRINLEQKFTEFTEWLEEFVLNYILSFPVANSIEENTAQTGPYEGPWPLIFTVCGLKQATKLLKGKNNPMSLSPRNRHVRIGSGIRLVPVHIPCDGRFPEIANNSFVWCDVNQNITQNSKVDDLLYSVTSTSSYSKFIVAIRLSRYDDVYVVDNSKFTDTCHKRLEDVAPRSWLTSKEIDDAYTARGSTIVPIAEYKGDYKEPIVLIGRQLDFDEIAWIVNTSK